MSSRKPPEHFTDGMIISEWDRDLILRCLNNYRVANARGKNPLSLNIFLTRLLLSGLTEQGYTEDGNTNFKEEALRRFVNGESRLEDDNAFAIQQYLIHKKFLRQEELGGDIDPDYLPGLLAVHDYLGDKSEKAITYIAKIRKTYHARIAESKSDKEIQLKIIFKKSDAFFFRVEEVCKTIVKEELRRYYVLNQKDNAKIGNTRRRGYGFVSTQLSIIYIFLHEECGKNVISYIQSEIINSEYRDTNLLTFMRSGEQVSVLSRQEDANLPIILNNIFEFSADRDQAKVNIERLFY